MSGLTRRGFIAGAGALLLARPVLALPERSIRVNASHQQGAALTIYPAPCELQVGDIITIAGVRVFSARYPENDALRQFVVVVKVEQGQTVLHLYPQIILRGDRYATVRELPRNGARIERDKSYDRISLRKLETYEPLK